jgi:flagellar hook-length control protein FliK
VQNPATDAATAAAPKKPASNDADGDQNDSGATPVSGAGSAPANVAAPVAAAIALNTVDATPAAPAAANASGSNIAIGQQFKSRAQASLQRGSIQDAQPVTGADTKSAAPADAANTTPSASNAAGGAATTQSGSPNALAGTSANTQAQAGNAAVPASNPQADANAQAGVLAAVRADGSSAAASGDGASNAQSATNVVKAASADLPNFGVATANIATSQAASATPGTASANLVPLSGLPITIAARAQAGSNQFDIRLDPPELGRIDVRLDVDSNGQVTSHVTVDRPETLALLQSQQPQLERALEQAGLKTADNGLQFTLRDQSFTGGNTGGGAQPSTAQQLVIPDSDLPPIDTAQIYSRWGLGSGVDITV